MAPSVLKLPLSFLETLASRPDVRFVKPAAEAATNTADSISEGNIAHRATEARNTFLADGTGVKIGVLSDSVDFLSTAQSNGVLASVTILPGQAGLGTGEGTAMLEIVHALAPGSELYFATAFSGEASFAQNIRDLHSAGCRIIVDDVTYFDESPFQDGIIAKAVNDVCADGALYFSSAGNSGNKGQGTSGTWEGDFKEAGAANLGRGGKFHDFGGSIYNTVLAGTFRRVDLFWADPLGASTNDYDVYVIDANGSVIRSSTNIQDGHSDPYESLNFIGVGERIVIVKQTGEDRYLYLSTFRGELSYSTAGSTRGHNASGASSAFSVAAIPVSSPPQPFVGGENERVESFSSDGPRRMFFNADGSAITPGDYSQTGGKQLLKPDLTAADGVTTSVPGFAPFFGTSAAAPHAAAISALLWSYTPYLQAADVRKILSDTALDIMALGFDSSSGAGIAMAFESLSAAPRLSVQNLELVDSNQNKTLDPNDCADVIITLQNSAAPATRTLADVRAVLTTTNPEVLVDPTPRLFPDLVPGGFATSSVPFRVSTSSLFQHTTETNFFLHITASNDFTVILPIRINSGVALGSASNFVATGLPLGIPDLGTADSSLNVSGMSLPLGKVKVAVHLQHTYDADLVLHLIGPDGTDTTLAAHAGANGQNYGIDCENSTEFSDDASVELVSAEPPFIGTYRPLETLSVFNGKSGDAVNGYLVTPCC